MATPWCQGKAPSTGYIRDACQQGSFKLPVTALWRGSCVMAGYRAILKSTIFVCDSAATHCLCRVMLMAESWRTRTCLSLRLLLGGTMTQS